MNKLLDSVLEPVSSEYRLWEESLIYTKKSEIVRYRRRCLARCVSRDLLDRPQPKPEDHAKVLAKEVQLPDGTLTPLDDQDTQIVLKLSADYKLNEVECVKLLLATHQQVRSL